MATLPLYEQLDPYRHNPRVFRRTGGKAGRAAVRVLLSAAGEPAGPLAVPAAAPDLPSSASKPATVKKANTEASRRYFPAATANP